MISPKVMSTAAAMALVLSVAAPTAGLAEYKSNSGGGVRANGGYRPPSPGGMTRAGPVVGAAPAVGGYRGGAPAARIGASAPIAQPGGGGGGVYRGGYGGGYNGGYRRGDRDRDRGGFVAGAVAGAVIGGAVASQGYGYYGGPGVYYAPSYYSDQYYDGPAVAPAPVADDAVAYCMQTYRSYDPQSGTYLGDDGYEHSCP